MPARRILVLAGTRMGRELSAALVAEGHHVFTSLAGVTRDPVLPPGPVRTGGFGGVEGLVDYLRGENIDLVADATHPFAVNMSSHASAAAAATGIGYMRLDRPKWVSGPGDRWFMAESVDHAATVLPKGAAVFLTIGRKEIEFFFDRDDISGIARMIERPSIDPPKGWQVVCARPPFDVESEKNLMKQAGITHLVAKNSGGDDGITKLVAARDLQIDVVLIKRPHKPVAPCFSEVGEFVRSLAKSLLP